MREGQDPWNLLILLRTKLHNLSQPGLERDRVYFCIILYHSFFRIVIVIKR
nr:MAG TPA: hypothetical protein [Bacteriophage sp.]